MNEKILLIILLYYIIVGTLGGIALYLSYDNAYINLWKNLRKKYKIIGCILIYTIIHPAILFTLITEISWLIIYKIIDLFELIFKKGD